MLHLHKPTREELRFRQELLSDPSTMSYNHAYGGTIVFPPARWEGWAAHWLDAADGTRFYRYLAREDGIFVGETAYHYDEAQRIYKHCYWAVFHAFSARYYVLAFRCGEKGGHESHCCACGLNVNHLVVVS